PSTPEPAEEAPATSDKVPATTREPVLELDIEALERASQVESAPAFKPDNDLPPPNPNTFKRPDTGRYRNTPVTSREDPDQPRTVSVEETRNPPGTGPKDPLRPSSKP